MRILGIDLEKDYLIFISIIVVGVICILVLALFLSNDYESCRKSCGIYRSTIIEDQCHCKTVDGWEFKNAVQK